MSAQALAFIRAKNNNYELKTALDVHGLNLYAAGRYQEAYQVARESVNLLKRIFVNDLEKETSLVEIRYKTAQLIQEKQLAELKAKKQRQVYLFSLIGFVLIIGSGFSLWSYRKNAKQKMLLQKQKLEAIIEGEEKERTRIAKDLHDGIVQNLTAIKLKLNEELADPAKIQESKASISSEIDRAAKEVRAIAYQMMPIALQQFGLVAALHDLMQKLLFPKGIKFEFDAVNIDNPEGSFEKEGRLPAKIEICLYRASQELLTNILKHSQASSVSFALTRRNNIVTLICEDNGKGFDETTIQKGIGMNSLVSRLEIVGGTIKFEHPENSGTIVYLTIPLG
jgi:signal transduction histidine kinase